LLAGISTTPATIRFDRSRRTVHGEPPPYPVALGEFSLPGLEGILAPSRPDSDQAEADAAKTTFLQAFQTSRILWRGHAKKGRKKPGRRAVLEETGCPSDRQYLTLRRVFPQGNSLVTNDAKFSFYSNLQQLSWGRKINGLDVACLALADRATQ
jgi:hypothetical protein